MTTHIANTDRFRADRWEEDATYKFYLMDTHNGGQECAGPFDTIEDATVVQDRANRLHALAGEYPGPWALWTLHDAVNALAKLVCHQFAAIEHRHGGGITYRPDSDASRRYALTTHATIRDAFAQLADGVLEGFAPVGVVDLDTGAAHGVHVATPVVCDIGGEGAPVVPWDDGGGLPGIEPGAGASSVGGEAVGH